MFLNEMYSLYIEEQKCYAYIIKDNENLNQSLLNFVSANFENYIQAVFDDDYNNMIIYGAPEYKTLGEYLVNKITKKQLFSLLKNIIGVADNLRDNKISFSQVVWNWEVIYVNPLDDSLRFIMVPVNREENSYMEIENLIRCILSSARYDLVENCHYVAQLLTILNEGTNTEETLKALHNVIKKLSADVTMRHKKTDDDKYNSARESSFDVAKQSWDSIMKNDEIMVTDDVHKPVPWLIRLKTNENIRINKDVFTIGKDPQAVDYAIKDNIAVSRFHAMLIKQNGVYYIKDNNSTNKTFVNGEELIGDTKKLLVKGTIITIAGEEFQYNIV